MTGDHRIAIGGLYGFFVSKLRRIKRPGNGNDSRVGGYFSPGRELTTSSRRRIAGSGPPWSIAFFHTADRPGGASCDFSVSGDLLPALARTAIAPDPV